MKLFEHQIDALEATKDLNKVAYYHDMGLGKTFTGAEKMIRLGARVNLVVCQKSKVDDWVQHFKDHYKYKADAIDLTKKGAINMFFHWIKTTGTMQFVGVINYDLLFRRKDLLNLEDFTLMLDESSMIQNENAKRSKFILKMHPKNIILLSGTPTSGKYEKLWSQLHLLGWNISKELFWRQYVDVEYLDNEGFPIKVVRGYKNVERLKSKMRQYGCLFLKTEDVFDLPDQVDNTIKIQTTKEYRKFKRAAVIEAFGREFVGDTTLTKMLYERMLCGSYNDDKIQAFCDLVESTNDRLIVFYNFDEELRVLEDKCIELDRPISIVNGFEKDLSCYDQCDNSVTFIQYQAGAMGLNLQKANKIIYFTPPLSSELFEQSKKRTHRIGQQQTCFYYYLTCKNSIEEKIYATLAMRRDYTNALFEEEDT